MNKYISFLLLLLSASLALNLYLLSNLPKQSLFGTSEYTNNPHQQHIAGEPLFNSTFIDATSDETYPVASDIRLNTPNKIPAPRPLRQRLLNRAELLTQANAWLKQSNLLTLGAFLQDYLKQYPQDMDFLLLEAKLKVETTLLSDAIVYYYDLLRRPATASQQNEISIQIKQLTQNTIQQLKRNYSWDILAMFVEPLLQIEPNNRQYILSLAIAYAELFQEGLMENVLASLDFDDPDAQNIRKIILAQSITPQSDKADDQDTIDTTPNMGSGVPLKKYGDQYVVEAILSSHPVALLIDTGASVTAISKQYFDTLSNRSKINYLGRFSIGTAGGSIMASMYQFQELNINHVTVQNLPVVILPMQGIGNADGLLGMNFLREFDFKIDQQQSVMFIQ